MLHEIKIVPRFHKTVLHTWKKSWAAFYPNDFLPRERRSGGGTIPKGEAEGARTDGQGWVSSEREGMGLKEEGSGQVSAFCGRRFSRALSGAMQLPAQVLIVLRTPQKGV